MSAVISPCGAYRYVLHRQLISFLSPPKPCLFIMLNPSTADAEQDDPTIRRCIGFANREGCTELTVVNLYARRATDPVALFRLGAVGPENDAHICEQGDLCRARGGIIIAAWGSHLLAQRRAPRIRAMFDDLLCLGTTKDGSPRHPLYVRKDAPLVPWKVQP